MSQNELGSGQPDGEKKRKSWFAPNRGGMGYHPATWQAWLILAVIIAAIVVVVVLLRSGVL